MDRLKGYRVEPAYVIKFISIIHIGSSPVGNADPQTLRRDQNPCPDQTPISLSLFPRCLRGRHARRSALRPMASGATSIRYGGAASVGGTADALNRILADLCTRGTPKVPTFFSESLASSLRLPSLQSPLPGRFFPSGFEIVLCLGYDAGVVFFYCRTSFDWLHAISLKKHVEEAARDLGGEAFSRCMDQFYDRIANLLESNEVADNLGALRAINELIDVSLGESASKVSKLSSYMRTLFEVKRDPEVLVLASEVLGHLVRAGGAMTADEVERQVWFCV
ncbi:hypothetical protein GW17_00040632 [Ensete ventricosum]|nr:hypothetical protein GW17_00040632 [Ensete ventricosum]